MFAFLGRLSTGHPWKVCTGWLVAGLLLTLLAPAWDAHVRHADTRYLPARCDSVRGQRLLEQAFPRDGLGSRVVVALDRDEPLTEKDLALAQNLRDDLADQNLGLVEPVHHAADSLALVRVWVSAPPSSGQTARTTAKIEELARTRLATAGSGTPRLSLAGTAIMGRDLARAAAWNRAAVPIALVVVLLAVLFLLYRRPLLAAAAVGVVLAAAWVGLTFMGLVTRLPGVSLGDASLPLAEVIVFGLAAVAVLFLVRHHLEERGSRFGADPGWTTRTVGPRLLAGTAVYASGWLLLGFAEYGRLRALGLDLILGLAVAVGGCLLLMPAAFQLLDRFGALDPLRPSSPSRRRKVGSVFAESLAAVRERLAHALASYPAVAGTLLLVVLTPLALYGLRVRVAERPETAVAARAASARGLACLGRHDLAGEADPTRILLVTSGDWNSLAGREFLAHLSDSLGRLPNIASVRTVATPHRPDAVPWIAALKADNDWLGPRSGQVTRLEVVFRSPPGSPESVATLELVQTWLRERMPSNAGALGSVAWECAGTTVTARDLGKVAGGDGARGAWLMLAALLAVVAVLVGRLETVIHLVLAIAVSYPVALGAAGLLSPWWGGAAGEVDWPTAALLFPILVAGGAGLSLMPGPRGHDERGRRDAEERLRRNLTWTARRTAGCALLLAGFWAVLLLVARGAAARLGLAASCGLLVDALVVRRMLVPALAVYLWRQQRELQGGWRELRDSDPVRRAG